MAGARRRISFEAIEWEDRIFIMEDHHKKTILGMRPKSLGKIVVLGIPDIYYRGDSKLVKLLKDMLSKNGITI